MQKGSARVAKLGQRRKVEGLVLSGPRVQIPSLAPILHTFVLISELNRINFVSLFFWIVHFCDLKVFLHN